MSTTAVIGLGIVVWILLAILVTLFVVRVIRLRDRQRPNRTTHGAPKEARTLRHPQ